MNVYFCILCHILIYIYSTKNENTKLIIIGYYIISFLKYFIFNCSFELVIILHLIIQGYFYTIKIFNNYWFVTFKLQFFKHSNAVHELLPFRLRISDTKFITNFKSTKINKMIQQKEQISKKFTFILFFH